MADWSLEETRRHLAEVVLQHNGLVTVVVDSEWRVVFAAGAVDYLTGHADPAAMIGRSILDFTHPDVVMDNLEFCVSHGIHAVVGTTGFDESRLRTLRGWLADSPGTGVLVAQMTRGVNARSCLRIKAILSRYISTGICTGLR